MHIFKIVFMHATGNQYGWTFNEIVKSFYMKYSGKLTDGSNADIVRTQCGTWAVPLRTRRRSAFLGHHTCSITGKTPRTRYWKRSALGLLLGLGPRLAPTKLTVTTASLWMGNIGLVAKLRVHPLEKLLQLWTRQRLWELGGFGVHSRVVVLRMSKVWYCESVRLEASCV